MLLNKERARRTLSDHNLAAVVAIKPENVFYLSGYAGVLYPLAGSPPWSAALFAADQTPSLAIVNAGALVALGEDPCWADEVAGFGRDSLAPPEGDLRDPLAARLLSIDATDHASPDVAAAVAAALRARGLDCARIGWDDPGFAQMVVQLFGVECEVAPAAEVLREIRAVKTSGEIDLLQAALAANEATFRSVFRDGLRGRVWQDLAFDYRTAFVQYGGRPMYEAGGVGQRSVATFADGGGPAAAGEPTFFDAGGTVGRYWTDTGRTVFIDRPTRRQQAILAAEIEGLEAVRVTAKPGVPAARLVEAFRQVIRRHNLPGDAWFWGHGLGLELYEWPRIRDDSPDVLAEGMVFNFESPFRAVGLGGVHIERTFVVTGDGCRCLSTLPDYLTSDAGPAA
jgi:Xaa-Pro aminopeptidase